MGADREKLKSVRTGMRLGSDLGLCQSFGLLLGPPWDLLEASFGHLGAIWRRSFK